MGWGEGDYTIPTWLVNYTLQSMVTNQTGQPCWEAIIPLHLFYRLGRLRVVAALACIDAPQRGGDLWLVHKMIESHRVNTLR